MSVFISKMFHNKISLSVLPDEYYYPFKSFFKTLVQHNVFDIGAVITLNNLSKSNIDVSAHAYNIIQGCTIILRKFQRNHEDMKKSKSAKSTEITSYFYWYVVALLHFCMINHHLPDLDQEWEDCSQEEYKQKQDVNHTQDQKDKDKITKAYFKELMQGKNNTSPFTDMLISKLKQLCKGHDSDQDKAGVEETKGEHLQPLLHTQEFLFSTMMFIYCVKVFLDDLCSLIPCKNQQKGQEMVDKVLGLISQFDSKLEDQVELKDLGITPIDIVNLQDCLITSDSLKEYFVVLILYREAIEIPFSQSKK